jgi:hypothetical protein
MQRAIRHSAISVWLLSVAILISSVHFSVAQAQNAPKKNRAAVAIACGKELTNQCNGVPWRTMLCACVKETQCNVANRLSRVAAIFSGA